tara:strand:+ start:6176 stop:6532 length:357 start_codon:yes stop_codon:yes gene_type:complete
MNKELKNIIQKLDVLKVLSATSKEIILKAPKVDAYLGSNNIVLTYSIKANDSKHAEPLQVLLHVRTEGGAYLSTFGCINQDQNKYIIDYFNKKSNVYMVQQYNKNERLKDNFKAWMQN